MRTDTEVIVVGGGPVGLFLALRLHALGVRCCILERLPEPARNSRAIGIHPPSMELYDALGLADRLLAIGVRVRRGHVVGQRGPLGTLEFEVLSGPFRFALSCPQDATEALLEEVSAERLPGGLRRGAELVGITQQQDWVTAEVRAGDGVTETITGRYLVGCDGKNSFVRQAMSIPASGGRYDQTFVMGDFADDSVHGSDAVLFLTAEGLVESFPLPGGLRRWVASTSEYVTEGVEPRVRALVGVRTGHDLSKAACAWRSAFGVQRLLAARFWQDRVLLAGDAAHVLSPIGGQGMNLGWLDAWALGEALRRVLGDQASPGDALGDYERRRRRSAARAIRRAELNMTLGLGGWWNPVRDGLVRVLLRSPAQAMLARLFTMRGL